MEYDVEPVARDTGSCVLVISNVALICQPTTQAMSKTVARFTQIVTELMVYCRNQLHQCLHR